MSISACIRTYVNSDLEEDDAQLSLTLSPVLHSIHPHRFHCPHVQRAMRTQRYFIYTMASTPRDITVSHAECVGSRMTVHY